MDCKISRASRIIVLFFAVSVLLIGGMIQISFQGYAEGTGDYPPPTNDIWLITNETYVKGETLSVSHNITIEDGGKLTLDDTTLILNGSDYGDLWITVKSGGELNIINNSNITQGTSQINYDFVFENHSKGLISQSEISDCGWDDGGSFQSSGGILIFSDEIEISNSTITYSYSGIIAFGASPKISDNIIKDNLKYGIILVNSSSQITGNKISTNPIGIYSLYSDPSLVNNEIFDNGDGARFYYSTINISGGKFSSNSPDDCTSGACSSQESGKGLYVEASELNAEGVEFSENSRGLILQYAIVHINNSKFSDNVIDGLTGEFAEATLTNSIFENNARYGIKWMYTPLEVDPSNTFQENNGEARIILEWEVLVRVTDSADDWVSNADVEFIGVGNSDLATTTILGQTVRNVAQYIISNDGIKTQYNPYKITAKKLAPWDGEVYQNSTTVDITNNTEINIVIPLKKPDLVLSDIDFSETPQEGNKVSIKIKVTNPGDAAANNVSLVVTQKDSNGKSSIVNKSVFSIGAKGESTLSISWTPEEDGEVTIFAELDDTKNIKETNEDNNEMEISVDVSQKNAPLFDDSYFMAGLITFLIILFGVMIYIMILRKKASEE
jgi:parallel beta-helix repeat protein